MLAVMTVRPNTELCPARPTSPVELALNMPDIFNGYRNSLSSRRPFLGFASNIDTEMAQCDFWRTPIFVETSPTLSDDTPMLSDELSTPSPTSSDSDGSSLYISSDSDNASPEISDDSDDSHNSSIPRLEFILPHKRLNLAPSCFTHGCVCGHGFEFRDMAYESRKRRNNRAPGVTIRPKVAPIAAKLRRAA